MTEQVTDASAEGAPDAWPAPANGQGTDDVIVLDGVRKEFGTFVAVERADFAIARGEFFSLLGPSGCGKTTLLKMIAGFEQPDSWAGDARGRRRVDRPAAPTQRQHRVPAVRAVPAHVGVRQRRLRPAGQEGSRRPRRAGGHWRCSTSSGSASSPTAGRSSSRAVSSSVSPLPGRSSTCRAHCCSTSPSPPSTSSSARRCSSS